MPKRKRDNEPQDALLPSETPSGEGGGQRVNSSNSYGPGDHPPGTSVNDEHQRTQFEGVLAAVAAELANVPEGQFDAVMIGCLKRVVEALHFDRSTILTLSGNDNRLQVSQCWAVEGVPYPDKNAVLDAELPWLAHQIRSGHMIRMSSAEDLPPEANNERAYVLDSGLKSSLMIPLIVEGTVLGAVGFGSMREQRLWPSGMVTRLRLVADVLALGLRRHQYAEGLESLASTISQLSPRRPSPDKGREEQLRRLAVRLMQTEQQERCRIGELLHEDIMQILAGVSMIMEAAGVPDSEKRSAANVRTKDLLGQAIRKLRALSAELRPEALSRIGVKAGILWLADHMRQTRGLAVQVHVDKSIDPVGDDVRFFLYDAARKLLDNVVTHAGCKQAELMLQRVNPQQVSLTVSDKGGGFDPTRLPDIPNGSFGLFSLREQAELLGGHLEVRSATGRGTQVTVTLLA